MPDPKFKTFALTIRPKDGVTDDHIKMVDKWITTRSEYYHIVTEKESFQRHIHAGVVLKKEITRANLATLLKRLFKDFTNEEQKVLLRGVKIMYNYDFISKYLSKGDDTVVVNSCLPEAGCMESYFPPSIKADSRTKKCSAYYHELERLWYVHNRPNADVNTGVVRDFLFKMMYSERCIPVINDDRGIVQTARHLTRWLRKCDSSTIQLAPFEHEE